MFGKSFDTKAALGKAESETAKAEKATVRAEAQMGKSLPDGKDTFAWLQDILVFPEVSSESARRAAELASGGLDANFLYQTMSARYSKEQDALAALEAAKVKKAPETPTGQDALAPLSIWEQKTLFFLELKANRDGCNLEELKQLRELNARVDANRTKPMSDEDKNRRRLEVATANSAIAEARGALKNEPLSGDREMALSMEAHEAAGYASLLEALAALPDAESASRLPEGRKLVRNSQAELKRAVADAKKLANRLAAGDPSRASALQEVLNKMVSTQEQPVIEGRKNLEAVRTQAPEEADYGAAIAVAESQFNANPDLTRLSKTDSDAKGTIIAELGFKSATLAEGGDVLVIDASKQSPAMELAQITAQKSALEKSFKVINEQAADKPVLAAVLLEVADAIRVVKAQETALLTRMDALVAAKAHEQRLSKLSAMLSVRKESNEAKAELKKVEAAQEKAADSAKWWADKRQGLAKNMGNAGTNLAKAAQVIPAFTAGLGAVAGGLAGELIGGPLSIMAWGAGKMSEAGIASVAGAAESSATSASEKNMAKADQLREQIKALKDLARTLQGNQADVIEGLVANLEEQLQVQENAGVAS